MISPHNVKKYLLRFLVVVGLLVGAVVIYGMLAWQLMGPEGESATLRVTKDPLGGAEATLMRDVLAEHCEPLLDALLVAQEGRTGFVRGDAASDTQVCLRDHYGLDLPAVVNFENETFFIHWQHVGPY